MLKQPREIISQKSLFKYRDFKQEERVLDFLINNKMFFSSPKNFNDPFDCNVFPLYNGTKKQIMDKLLKIAELEYPNKSKNYHLLIARKDYKKKKEIYRDPEKSREYVKAEVDNLFGIFSLSEKKDNILMWSHYAESHTGYCVEFDCSKLVDFISRNTKEVKYLLMYKVDISKVSLNFDPWSENSSEHYTKILTAKSEDWEYEKEWRMIYMNNANVSMSFPSDLIKAVYMGARISEENRSKICFILKCKKHNPKLFQMELHRTQYKLVSKPVEY